MIRVNLVGTGKKKAARAVAKSSGPIGILPIVMVLIVVATIGGGYWWYSSLETQATDMNAKISQAMDAKAKLEAVIKQDQVYEGRKKALENRIKVIEGLKRNQVSPVVSLDLLGDAIDKTQYVWLNSLDQNNTTFSMSGTGTSVNAIADFVTNLEGTGYFRNINLQNAQDAQGTFTFSMTCEFSPPASAAGAASKGGN